MIGPNRRRGDRKENIQGDGEQYPDHPSQDWPKSSCSSLPNQLVADEDAFGVHPAWKFDLKIVRGTGCWLRRLAGTNASHQNQRAEKPGCRAPHEVHHSAGRLSTSLRSVVVAYVPHLFREVTPAMSKDAQLTTKEPSSSMMEDFGRFSPVEMLDSDPDITDESFLDEAYGEENAGA